MRRVRISKLENGKSSNLIDVSPHGVSFLISLHTRKTAGFIYYVPCPSVSSQIVDDFGVLPFSASTVLLVRSFYVIYFLDY